MNRVRGGVFSGALVLAGISATLLSALLAIGIRQVTVHAQRPVQVSMVPSSGEVAVPDATATPTPAHPRTTPSAVPAYAPVPAYDGSSSRTTTGSTTGSTTSGGSVATPAPTPSTSTPRTSPTPTPTPTKPGHGHSNGSGKGHPR